jgi:hypothetical protein
LLSQAVRHVALHHGRSRIYLAKKRPLMCPFRIGLIVAYDELEEPTKFPRAFARKSGHMQAGSEWERDAFSVFAHGAVGCGSAMLNGGQLRRGCTGGGTTSGTDRQVDPSTAPAPEGTHVVGSCFRFTFEENY